MFTRQLFGSLFLVVSFGALVVVGFQVGRLERIPDSELDSIFGGDPPPVCAAVANSMPGTTCAGASDGTNTCPMPGPIGDINCGDYPTRKCPRDCPNRPNIFPYQYGRVLQAFPQIDCPQGTKALCILNSVGPMPCKCSTAPNQISNVVCNQTYRPACGT